MFETKAGRLVTDDEEKPVAAEMRHRAEEGLTLEGQGPQRCKNAVCLWQIARLVGDDVEEVRGPVRACQLDLTVVQTADQRPVDQLFVGNRLEADNCDGTMLNPITR